MRVMRLAIIGLISGLLTPVAACGWLMPRARWREAVVGWTRRTWARWLLRVVRVRVRVEPGDAEFPAHGLYVANHTGYLDVVVAMSIAPGQFVARADVRWWPVVGQLAALGGVMFVDRTRRLSVGGIVERARRCLGRGGGVVFFPEATTSNGEGLLAFRSSLFAAAEGEAGAGIEVRPMVICYRTLGGRPIDATNRDEVYWYSEVGFGSHVWNLLRAKRIEVTVRALAGRAVGADRHVFARALREEMLRELEEMRRGGGG